jgi:hypothetical protein
MSTIAQMNANKTNAQKSTGPRTPEGKSRSAQNNFRHGFTGAFSVLPGENQSEFDQLLESLHAEHQPTTPTESLLLESLAQHYWLKQRALRLLNACDQSDEKQIGLYLRYQTTNDRAFHKALDQLLKLRAERRKAEIGFESQRRRQTEEARRQRSENRREERHRWALLFDEARVDGQRLQNLKLAPPNYPVAPSIASILGAERPA